MYRFKATRPQGFRSSWFMDDDAVKFCEEVGIDVQRFLWVTPSIAMIDVERRGAPYLTVNVNGNSYPGYDLRLIRHVAWRHVYGEEPSGEDAYVILEYWYHPSAPILELAHTPSLSGRAGCGDLWYIDQFLQCDTDPNTHSHFGRTLSDGDRV